MKRSLLAEFQIPLLILGAFLLGAGGMWLIMRTSAPSNPPRITTERVAPSQGSSSPPDVSNMSPVDAARSLADWNYDRQNWSHAIEHYQEAISRGADNPDVRTDLGNCFRFLGQYEKAREQYEIAQKENPQHENSLFNQISLFADFLHDQERAQSAARDFIARFPQSPHVQFARQIMERSQNASKTGQ